MIMVDTSAWVEFLRDTGSPACRAVDRLLDADLACCDAVSMEVLAGATGEAHLTALSALLARAVMVPTTAADFDAAAALHRTCRTRGETVRKLSNCLIGAVALRAGAEVLHADADFEVLARHTAVRTHDDVGA